MIQSWDCHYPRCNWGLKTGPESGIWALDIDGEPGRESLSTFVAQNGEDWTRTVTVQTAKGLHFYFSYPTEGLILNSASKNARARTRHARRWRLRSLSSIDSSVGRDLSVDYSAERSNAGFYS